MSQLVTNIEQIISNVFKIDSYASGNKKEISFFSRRIKNGKNFVCIKKNDKYYFSPSKFAGYIDNDLSHEDHLHERDGRKTDVAIARLMELAEGSLYKSIMDSLNNYRDDHNTGASRHAKPHKFWFFDTDGAVNNDNETHADDDDNYKLNNYYLEGNRIYKEMHLLSRNRNLVSEAKIVHGLNCQVCNFNFEDFYGPLGAGIIECHHLVPISKKGLSKISVSEVCVLCSNCHRMVHRKNPPISLSDLTSRIKKKF